MVADSILTGQALESRVVSDSHLTSLSTMRKPDHESTCEPIGRYGAGDSFQAALGSTLGPSWKTSVETVRIPNPS